MGKRNWSSAYHLPHESELGDAEMPTLGGCVTMPMVEGLVALSIWYHSLVGSKSLFSSLSPVVQLEVISCTRYVVGRRSRVEG